MKREQVRKGGRYVHRTSGRTVVVTWIGYPHSVEYTYERAPRWKKRVRYSRFLLGFWSAQWVARNGVVLPPPLGAPEGDEIEDPLDEEIRLAGHLAEFVCDSVDLKGAMLDEGIDVFVDGWIHSDPPPPQPHRPRAPGPRSPIEMMVDRACGIEEATFA